MGIHITSINNMAAVVRETQNNISDIAHGLGWKEMGIYAYPVHTDTDNDLSHRLDGIIASLQINDIAMIQYPTWNGHRFDQALAEKLKLYARKLIIFVQDITVMLLGRQEEVAEAVQRDIAIFEMADLLILASPKLYETLQGYGLKNKNVMYQKIWDFPTHQLLTDHAPIRRMVFTGGENLNYYTGKTPIHQFSVQTYDRTPETNVIRHEFMEREALLRELAKGGFGLVFADDALFYRYDCMNQPYKLASYLAAGLPVVVRKGCAHENFVKEQKIGFVVESVEEADSLISALTDEEIMAYYRRVAEIQYLITTGAYTRSLLAESVLRVMEL